MSDNKRSWDRYSTDQQGDEAYYRSGGSAHGSSDYKRERRGEATPASSYDYNSRHNQGMQEMSFGSSSTPSNRGYPPQQQPYNANYDDRERGHRVPSPYGNLPAGPTLSRRQNSYPGPGTNYLPDSYHSDQFGRVSPQQFSQQHPPALMRTLLTSAANPRYSNFGPPLNSHESFSGGHLGPHRGIHDRYLEDVPLVRINSNVERERVARERDGRGYSSAAPIITYEHYPVQMQGPWHGMAGLGFPHYDRERYHIDAPPTNRRESWRDEWRAGRGLKEPLSKQRAPAWGAGAGAPGSCPSIRSSKRILPRKFGSSAEHGGVNGRTLHRVNADGIADSHRIVGATGDSEAVIDDEGVLSLMRTSECVVDAHVSNCLFALDVDLSFDQLEGAFYK